MAVGIQWGRSKAPPMSNETANSRAVIHCRNLGFFAWLVTGSMRLGTTMTFARNPTRSFSSTDRPLLQTRINRRLFQGGIAAITSGHLNVRARTTRVLPRRSWQDSELRGNDEDFLGSEHSTYPLFCQAGAGVVVFRACWVVFAGFRSVTGSSKSYRNI